MLELRKLEYKDKENLIRYLQYWYDNNEKIIPSILMSHIINLLNKW